MPLANAGKSLDEETVETPETPAAPALSPEVLQQIRQGQQAEIFNGLLNDPEIGAVLRLRQQGKRAVIREEGVETSSAPASAGASAPPSPPDLTKMSEAEKMQYLVKQVSAETTKVLDQRMKPIDQRLAQMEQYGQQLKTNDVVQQVESVKKEFGAAEFESLKPRMAELLTENPNLGARRLFLLAQAESGRTVPATTRTSSERPSIATGKPHKKLEVSRGSMGIRELLASAAPKVYDSLNGEHHEEE